MKTDPAPTARFDVLVADSECCLPTTIADCLHRYGIRAIVCQGRRAAMEELRRGQPRLVVVTSRVEHLVSDIRKLYLRLPIITLIEGRDASARAHSIEGGAFDSLPRDPLDLAALVKSIQRALDVQPEATPDVSEPSPMVGDSSAMRAVGFLIERFARRPEPVLIQGETGVGKELVAERLHKLGGCRGEFVAINCAAMPEQLLESELFGHVKGAFTSAHTDKVGLIETAEDGTFLLDEVNAMPITLQARLLRFLQEKRVRRVGGTATKPVRVRILAASNEDLRARCEAKQFRPDLFHRLDVLAIHVPALRERRSDIRPLIMHFLHGPSDGPVEPRISDAAMALLEAYSWPGNVRELESVLHRAMALADGCIDVPHLAERVVRGNITFHPVRSEPDDSDLTLKHWTQCNEAAYIRRVLLESGDSKAAAKRLGISQATLYRKLAAERKNGFRTDRAASASSSAS